MAWQVGVAVASDRPAGEDRAAVCPTAFGGLAVVADGVGGRSGGAAAAEAVVAAVRSFAETLTAPPDPRTWATWLRQLDAKLAAEAGVGETTAVVAALSPVGVTGVAAGDSVAWAVGERDCHYLTIGSEPKPWLGSGAARPVLFGHLGRADTLLLATDGLTKYADPRRLADLVRGGPWELLPGRLIDAIRYASGRLPDDVGVVVARWPA